MSNPNEPDQVNSGALSVVIVLVAIATLAVALVVTSLVRQETGDVTAERDALQDKTYRNLKASQLAELTASPSWVDRAQGLVAIPIERAMALTLEAVRKNPYALSPGLKPEEQQGLGGAGPESAEAETEAEAEQAAPTEDTPTPAPKKVTAPVPTAGGAPAPAPSAPPTEAP